MDDHEELFREVFGESSDREDHEDQRQQHSEQILDGTDDDRYVSALGQNHEPSWEQVKEINGLWLHRNFLSAPQQASLLSAIQKEGWFTEESHNQAMRFGDLPEWATELSNFIREAVLPCDSLLGSMDLADADEAVCILPSALLWREPLFDQLIVNLYQPGEGICAHVDLMRFEDGIAIVSLESSCVMHFSEVEEACDTVHERGNGASTTKVPVYLTPGSLVLMSGEARYLWKHEINRKPGFQMWKEQELDQKRRVSITLRKLCQVE